MKGVEWTAIIEALRFPYVRKADGSDKIHVAARSTERASVTLKAS